MKTLELFTFAFLLPGTPSQPTVELPVTVHVFADAHGDTGLEEVLSEVVREVEKKMKGRKKLFRIAEDEEEALVLIEVLRLWEEEVAQKSYQPMNTNDPEQRPVHEYLAIGKIQLAEIEVRVGKDAPVRATASRAGRHPKNVADAIRTVVELHLARYRQF